MTTIVLIIIVCALGIILGLASTKPRTFRYERSIAIHAAPEKIFPYLNDLHKGSQWSPWEKKDPNIVVKHSGAAEGVGAVYEWNGNNQVGAGRMEIIESVAPVNVLIKIDFYKPMKSTNSVQYTLVQAGDITTMTWTMYGNNNFMGKLISVFIDCEEMCGREFDKGLASLKSIVEAE